MRVLVDTNVIIRIADRAATDHAVAEAAAAALRDAHHQLCIVPQNLYEYWVVATRPTEHNGLGMSSESTDAAIEKWIQLFHLMRDERTVFEHWWNLVRDYSVAGKPAHDARLVAAMLRHGIEHLLTFNAADFARYSTIEVLTPGTVVKQGS
jgi:predicted nucleic acid-binding protein